MKNFTLLLFVVMSIASKSVNSQDIKEHQWQDRLVFLLAEDTLNENYQKQIEDLKQNIKGLEDRKLIIYQVQKDQYNVGLNTKDWTKSEKLWNKYKATNAAFEFILIGLDGGIKLRKTDYFSSEELYKVIDVMPMRRQELKQD